MNNKTLKYLTELNKGIDKFAFRGQLISKAISNISNIYNKTPNTFFNQTSGKMIDLTPTLDRIMNTGIQLNSMIKREGIAPRVSGITRSIQSDYAKLFRNRMSQLKNLTNTKNN